MSSFEDAQHFGVESIGAGTPPVTKHILKVVKNYDEREDIYWTTECSCGQFKKNGITDISALFHVLESMGVAEFDPVLLTGVQYKTRDRDHA